MLPNSKYSQNINKPLELKFAVTPKNLSSVGSTTKTKISPPASRSKVQRSDLPGRLPGPGAGPVTARGDGPGTSGGPGKWTLQSRLPGRSACLTRITADFQSPSDSAIYKHDRMSSLWVCW